MMGDHATEALDAMVDMAWFSPPNNRTNEPRCKYCGSSNVQWVSNNGKWRLFDIGGTAHICDAYHRP